MATAVDLRDPIRKELEATRLAYHNLLAAIPDDGWDRPTANPAWNVRQMMAHIIVALRFLPEDVALLRRGRVPNVPVGLFNWVNKWFTRWLARRQTRTTLAAEYDRRHAALLALLDTIQPQEWALAGDYPDIDNLRGRRTIADMFHYISVHFEEHAADVRQALAVQRTQG